MKKKKPTAGEEIMATAVGRNIEDFRSSPIYPMERITARSIDAAIRRAVRKALKEAFHPSIDASREYRLAERERVAAKYGVKL